MASSIDAIPTKALEILLECSVCLETLNEPRTLACFHSFCEDCLGNFVQGLREKNENPEAEVNTFECPVCRSEFTLKPGEGVEGIGSNYFIRNMLDVLAVESRVKGIPCRHCKKASAGRCVNCEIFICEGCIQAHNNYLGNQSHAVLSMDELSKPENRWKIRGKPRCREHDDEILKFFCETCEELICRDCKDDNHAEHQSSPLKKAAEQKTEELKGWCATLTDEFNKSNEALQAMNNVVQVLDENMQAAKKKIRQRKDEILAAVGRMLDKKEISLTKKIDTMFQNKNDALSKQLGIAQVYANQVKSSMNVCKSLLENGNVVEIVSSHALVGRNIEKVKTEHPESWDPVDDGNLGFNQCPKNDFQMEIQTLSERLGKIKGKLPRQASVFETINMLRVLVYEGDITEEETDIIVNTSKSDLVHNEGVSLAIANAGGPLVQRESSEYVEKNGNLSPGDAAITGPGQLKCKKIIHVFGPMWRKYGKERSIELLKKLLHNVFKICSLLKAESVAMPAISYGLLGMPVDACAETIFWAINELDNGSVQGLARPFEIRLVDIDQEIVKVFRKMFSTWVINKRVSIPLQRLVEERKIILRREERR